MVRTAVIVVALLLAGCQKPPTREELNVADVNSRNALARVSALASRVDELEEEIEKLRSIQEDNALQASSDNAEDKAAAAENSAAIAQIAARLAM